VSVAEHVVSAQSRCDCCCHFPLRRRTQALQSEIGAGDCASTLLPGTICGAGHARVLRPWSATGHLTGNLVFEPTAGQLRTMNLPRSTSRQPGPQADVPSTMDSWRRSAAQPTTGKPLPTQWRNARVGCCGDPSCLLPSRPLAESLLTHSTQEPGETRPNWGVAALVLGIIAGVLLQAVYVPFHLLAEAHEHQQQQLGLSQHHHQGSAQDHEPAEDPFESLAEHEDAEVHLHAPHAPEEAHSHRCELVFSRTDSSLGSSVLICSPSPWAVEALHPGDCLFMAAIREPTGSGAPANLQARAPPVA